MLPFREIYTLQLCSSVVTDTRHSGTYLLIYSRQQEKKMAEMEKIYTADVASKVTEIKSLKHEMTSLQEAFENSEELAESLREENNELRETLSAKVNTTVHQETEKRCFELVEDLDALSKEKHTLCKQIKHLEKEKENLERSLKDANDRSEKLEKNSERRL